ncbi:hypothetical protein [Streptomyces sp. NPDC060366]|uniref:hypothetical protein n=1 Tax=Streptomyces sp. NPDC060366 TaxID=3347105 RepID=UPI00366914CB
MTVVESWVFMDGNERGDGALSVAPDEAVAELRRRIARGSFESWLAGSSGRLLAVVTNAERAMVVLLAGEGDPGEHATDPGAEGWSDGFVLANGQGDEYPDEDTLPLDEALRIVGHILATGGPPADAAWTVDR